MGGVVVDSDDASATPAGSRGFGTPIRGCRWRSTPATFWQASGLHGVASTERVANAKSKGGSDANAGQRPALQQTGGLRYGRLPMRRDATLKGDGQRGA